MIQTLLTIPAVCSSIWMRLLCFSMMRPVFIFKVLVLSLVTNFVCIVYLLLQRSHHSILTDGNSNDHDPNDFSYRYENNPLLADIQVIPMVHSVRRDSSRSKLTDGFRIASNQKILSKDLQAAIVRYSNYISLIGHISTKLSTQTSNGSPNELLLDCSSIDWQKIHSYPKMDEDESYQLHINHTGSYLTSSTLTGFIRGLSTYVQLIEIDSQSKESVVPHVLIDDRARFVWRGLMLDVCRHWIPMESVKRTLDAMEMSKLNVLHLHLSDDQGFRVESIRYPLLHDRKSFFTQGEIRHLVEYARQRRIRVIPEFDIPGHTTRYEDCSADRTGIENLCSFLFQLVCGISWVGSRVEYLSSGDALGCDETDDGSDEREDIRVSGWILRWNDEAISRSIFPHRWRWSRRIAMDVVHIGAEIHSGTRIEEQEWITSLFQQTNPEVTEEISEINDWVGRDCGRNQRRLTHWSWCNYSVVEKSKSLDRSSDERISSLAFQWLLSGPYFLVRLSLQSRSSSSRWVVAIQWRATQSSPRWRSLYVDWVRLGRHSRLSNMATRSRCGRTAVVTFDNHKRAKSLSASLSHEPRARSITTRSQPSFLVPAETRSADHWLQQKERSDPSIPPPGEYLWSHWLSSAFSNGYILIHGTVNYIQWCLTMWKWTGLEVRILTAIQQNRSRYLSELVGESCSSPAVVRWCG